MTWLRGWLNTVDPLNLIQVMLAEGKNVDHNGSLRARAQKGGLCLVSESEGTSRKRGDRSLITAEILSISIDGKLKTKIMYGVNLSFKQANKYLSFLLKRGLLKVGAENNRVLYKTTSKGVKYLENYEKVSSFLRMEGSSCQR